MLPPTGSVAKTVTPASGVIVSPNDSDVVVSRVKTTWATIKPIVGPVNDRLAVLAIRRWVVPAITIGIVVLPGGAVHMPISISVSVPVVAVLESRVAIVVLPVPESVFAIVRVLPPGVGAQNLGVGCLSLKGAGSKSEQSNQENFHS